MRDGEGESDQERDVLPVGRDSAEDGDHADHHGGDPGDADLRARRRVPLWITLA